MVVIGCRCMTSGIAGENATLTNQSQVSPGRQVYWFVTVKRIFGWVWFGHTCVQHTSRIPSPTVALHTPPQSTTKNKMSQQQYQHQVNEEVKIVRGVYKRQGKGIYKGPYGKKMCTVEVIDGERRYCRNIWLTSIQPSKTQRKQTSTRKESKGTATELKAIKEEVRLLTVALRNLQLRVNEIEEKV